MGLTVSILWDARHNQVKLEYLVISLIIHESMVVVYLEWLTYHKYILVLLAPFQIRGTVITLSIVTGYLLTV